MRLGLEGIGDILEWFSSEVVWGQMGMGLEGNIRTFWNDAQSSYKVSSMSVELNVLEEGGINKLKDRGKNICQI